MPRIPKGNFDSAPSLDVGSAKIAPVETVGTKLLRQAGSAGLQISKSWDNVKSKANALEGVVGAEKEVNTLGDKFKEMSKDSVRGKLSDGTDLVEATQKEIETMRLAHAAESKDNPDRISMYNQIVIPKFDKMLKQAEALKSEQIVKGTDEDLRAKEDEIAMMNITGQDYSEQKHALNIMYTNAEGVMSRDDIAKRSARLEKTMAMSAHKELEYKGWSPEAEARVRRKISGANLTKAERVAADMGMEQAIAKGQAVTKRKSDREFKDFMTQLTTPAAYLASKEQAKTVLKNYQQLPIQPYESQEERDAKIGELVSTMVANEVFVANQGILKGKTANGHRDMAGILDQAKEIKKSIMGDGRIPSTDKLDDKIIGKIAAMQEKINSRGGALSTFQSVDPLYVQDMNSGDKDRIADAQVRKDKFYNDNQVDAHNRTEVTLDEAEAYGKMYAGSKGLGKGDADPDGRQQLGIVRKVQEKYGNDRSGRALDDIISFGGGTKSGKTNVPATWAVMPYIGDDNFAATVLSAHNRMDENISAWEDPKGMKQKVDLAIRQNTDLTKLRHGQLSDNDTFANGYADSIKALAYSEMVKGESPKDAVEKAEELMHKHLAISNHKKGTVMLPAHILAKKGYTNDDLDEATDTVTNFEALNKVGMQIAWDKMNPAVTGKGSSLAPILDKIRKEKNPNAQAALAQKYLGDRIMLVNNGRDNTGASIYLKTYDSKPIPLIMDAGLNAQGQQQYSRSRFNMLDVIGKTKEEQKKYKVEKTKKDAYRVPKADEDAYRVTPMPKKENQMDIFDQYSKPIGQ